jgi:hypothetical protein
VWTYKTAIMLALAQPEDERYVPLEDYRYFYEYRRPPHGTYIWAGRVEPDFGDGGYQAAFGKTQRTEHRRADGTIDRVGYRLSFSIVSLVLQVIKDPYEARLDRPRRTRAYWARLQPISKGEWPPLRSMSLTDLYDLHNGRFIDRS